VIKPPKPGTRFVAPLESGDWENTSVLAKQLHLDETEIADSYWQAMQWARQVSGG
jgi:hypothetical protein